MIPSRSEFDEIRLPSHESSSEVDQHEELQETFLKLFDLLEQYAPPWYSDQLREEAESVLRQRRK